MSSQDLVKQIILKFKTEGSDQAKKAAESISKSLNSRETDRFLKNMESVNKKFGSAGKDLSTDMKKVTEYFKELNNTHFQKAERNLDRMGRLIKRQIEDLDKLKRSGGSAADIKARESSLGRASDSFNRMAESTPAPRPTSFGGRAAQALRGISGVGGTAGVGIGLAQGVAAALGGGAAIAGAVRDYTLQETQNKSTVANRFKQDAFEVYNGNLAKSLLYSDPKRANAINSRTRRANTAGDWQAGLGTAAGVLGGAATIAGAAWSAAQVGGAVGTAFGGPLGTLAGGLVGGAIGAGGAYLAGRSVQGGLQYFKGGGREAARTQNRASAEEDARAGTFNDEYYQDFAGKAAMRYQYQRTLQMGDSQSLEFRKQMRGQGITDEGEMAGIAGQFRRFGVHNAASMGIQAATGAKAMGQDVNATSGLLSSFAATNRGGSGNAMKDLEAVFTRAVKSGISDSALIEEYQKQSAAILEVSKGRMTGTEAATQLDRFMMGGANERDLAGAQGARQAYGQTLAGSSSLMSAKKTAGILDLAKGEDGKVDMLSYQLLSQMSPEQLGSMSDTQLKDMGISKGAYSNFQKQQVQGTRRSNMGAKEAGVLLDKVKNGDELSPFEQEKLAISYGMNNVPGRKQEEIQGFLKGVLGNEPGINTDTIKFKNLDQTSRGTTAAITNTPEEVKSSIMSNTDNTLAGKAKAATAQGQNKLDEDVNTYMQKNMGAALKIFEAQAKEVNDQLSKNVIGGSVAGISKAADDVAAALRETANKIRNGGGLSPHTQAGSKNGGEGE